MSIPHNLGTEATFASLGQTWRLSKFSRAIWRDFLVWAKAQIPDPVAEALKVVEKLHPDVQAKVVEDALDRSRRALTIGSPEVQALMETPEGSLKVLHLLLQKHHPDLTEDGVLEVLMGADPEELEASIAKAHGARAPKGNGQAQAE